MSSQPIDSGELDPPTPPNRFGVREVWADRVAVVAVHGDLDMLTAPQLAQALADAAGKGPDAVVVDLTGVEFLASAGMSTLVTARDAAGESRRFAVVADGPATSRPLTLMGLDTYLRLYPTLDEALADLD